MSEPQIIPSLPQVLCTLFEAAFWFAMGWSWRGERERRRARLHAATSPGPEKEGGGAA